jgi:hypothetical protein
MRAHPLAIALFAAAVAPMRAQAADHVDSPATTAEPAADITDVYAWMSADAARVNLILNVSPFAGADATFSDAVQYVLHVASSAGYGQPQMDTRVVCQFYDVMRIECWAGDAEYVAGDPSNPAGLASQSGRMRVFAGLRNDPFFFELDGFKHAVETVVAAAGTLTFDDEGCPAVDAATSGVIVGQLQHDGTGGAAHDTFAGANVLAIVVQIDKAVVTPGGPVLAVWGSTHRAP